MSKSIVIGITAGVLLAFVLVGFVLWQGIGQQDVRNQVSHIPSEQSVGVQTSPPPSPQSDTSVLDTRDWQTYTSPTFTYSIQIHADWQERKESSNTQKRFRIYTEDPKGVLPYYDDVGRIEAEFQILTLAYDDPAFAGKKEDFQMYKELAPGTEITDAGVVMIKAQNMYLDGCIAPQFSSSGLQEDPMYATVCAGENRYIVFLLESKQKEILEKYKAVYEAMLSTFRFNNFEL